MNLRAFFRKTGRVMTGIGAAGLVLSAFLGNQESMGVSLALFGIGGILLVHTMKDEQKPA
jgi:hypothetical protein